MDITKISRALADLGRYEILKSISEKPEISCSEITSKFTVAQPTISYHLKILQDAGLVKVRRKGQWSFFSVDQEVLKEFLEAIRNDLTKTLK